MQVSNEEWHKKLTPEQYHILREKGTEAPYTGALLNNKQQGTYVCAACGNVLFDAGTKFDSHCGWPSFYDAKPSSVNFSSDTTAGMERTEITCANCGGHLGHIFPDAPDQPTGQRYCVNSLALQFLKK